MQADDTTQLITALRRAASALVADRSIRDLEQTLAQIVHAAVDTVPGADAGGISIADEGVIGSRVPTNGTISELDQLQGRLGEGPCITAVVDPPDGGIVHAIDLSVPPDSERWPKFAPRAVELGYRSLLSTQLSADDGEMRAALNLYSREPDTFGDTARTMASLFALQAAILLYGAQHAVNLGAALDTRDVIGQAKGILMERFDIDDDRAFQMLVRSSQDTNLKLAAVASWLASHDGRKSTLRLPVDE